VSSSSFDFAEKLKADKSIMIMFYNTGGAKGTKTAFDNYGFKCIDGYYASSVPKIIKEKNTPRMASINLKTGLLMYMTGNPLSTQNIGTILGTVAGANE